MTSRRARIKGIANIPIRRKNEIQTLDNISKNTTSESVQNTESTLQVNNEQNTPVNISKETEQQNDICVQSAKDNLTSTPIESQSNNLNETVPEDQHESENQIVTVQTNTENNTISETEKIDEQVPKDTKENSAVKTEYKQFRRWIQKPSIRIPAQVRRPKRPSLSETGQQESTTTSNENTTTQTDLTNLSKETTTVTAVEKPVEIDKISNTNDSGISLPTQTEPALIRPISPSKSLTRPRIKPVPTFVRRSSIHGSASESEDDGRKFQNRVRNDSVCSTTSQSIDTALNKNKVTSVRAKIGQVHKKFQRSEQARKISEARRHFYQTFGANAPDKKRLTMLDLIYYNPSTNPMPRREKAAVTNAEPIITVANEEEVDDPNETRNEDYNPVPQVKVGPDGEIILDEQSLVIEQTGTKQGREQLANSQVIVDDLDKSYGIYKKAKRTKEWSAIETLRFYRTLNTVGTDFSLMLSLFPGRTRRDLKSKFKREERNNRYLIDKVLMNPLKFDLSELEKQLIVDQTTKETKKKEQEKRIKQPRRKRRRNRCKSLLARDLDDGDIIPKTVRPQSPSKPNDLYSILENGLDYILRSDIEDEVKPAKIIKTEISVPRPSRACRNRRVIRYMQSDSDESANENEDNMEDPNEINEPVTEPSNNESGEENHEAENNTSEVSCNELVPSTSTASEECILPNILPEQLPPVEPGSLMILSSKGPEGQNIYKVFMVTPGNVNVPVNLSPEVIESLSSNLGQSETMTLDLPVINESISDAQTA